MAIDLLITAPWRTTQDQLQSLRFLTDGQLNNGALLVLSHDPAAYIPGAYLGALLFDGLAHVGNRCSAAERGAGQCGYLESSS
ncbi:hypothetical protein [Spiribacter vilamensis]|uniref:Uncharacterized protein n=1 Tax=Spiribacter vilamensis TaxID=531306 RepID=A0A4Q8D1B4_9GAMM|nr:hypothetical protein [Spiribacter vilamensis]RZU99118.1 hypothetical protein EV698_1398 [Spiribacter vilamensis]TVO61886.1 hypothetical protein FPL09_07210 [Spiribacter vilamensis]